MTKITDCSLVISTVSSEATLKYVEYGNMLLNIYDN